MILRALFAGSLWQPVVGSHSRVRRLGRVRFLIVPSRLCHPLSDILFGVRSTGAFQGPAPSVHGLSQPFDGLLLLGVARLLSSGRHSWDSKSENYSARFPAVRPSTVPRTCEPKPAWSRPSVPLLESRPEELDPLLHPQIPQEKNTGVPHYSCLRQQSSNPKAQRPPPTRAGRPTVLPQCRNATHQQTRGLPGGGQFDGNTAVGPRTETNSYASRSSEHRHQRPHQEVANDDCPRRSPTCPNNRSRPGPASSDQIGRAHV